MNFIHSYKIELILIVLSLVVHGALFAVMIAKQGSVLNVVRVDDGYFEIAQNVLAGHGFSWSSQTPYAPNALRTPGYIYVLAGLIRITGVTGAALIQLVAASLIPLFGMYIARSITKSKNASVLVGVILALDPTLAFLSFQFYTDTLFILLFLPWFLLTLHYAEKPNMKALVVSALLLGCATLVRPVTEYIPILIALCIIWQFGKNNWRNSVMHIGVYFLIVGTILTPWIMRNVTTFGSPGLSAQAPFILYTNLTPAVISVADHSNFLAERSAFLTFAEYKGDAITLSNARNYTQKTLEVVRKYPKATAFVISKSLFSFFTDDGFSTLFTRLGYGQRDFLAAVVATRLAWVLITLAGFIGAGIYIFKNRTPWALFTVTLVAYFALTSSLTAFGMNPRYRLPVDPIIISLATIGFTFTLMWMQKQYTALLLKK